MTPFSATRRPFWTPFSFLLFLIVLGGFAVLGFRFWKGLGASTALSQDTPWGIWNIWKLTGFALSAGSFVTVLIAHVFNREKYHLFVRPALILSFLGYSFVAFTVFFDIGSYVHIWHLFRPDCWQFNSPLFEVGWSLMLYLSILTLEFIPLPAEALRNGWRLPLPFSPLTGLCKWGSNILDRVLRPFMPLLLAAGVTFSFMHQSSLGTLMVIAPSKLAAAWYSPLLPLLVLLSAAATGIPMVLMTLLLAARVFGRSIPKPSVIGLYKIGHVILGVYLLTLSVDWIRRAAFLELPKEPVLMGLLSAELGCFIFAFLIGLIPYLRRSVPAIVVLSFMTVCGTILNRANLFQFAYSEPFPQSHYCPLWTEWAVLIGLTSTIVFLYRMACIYLPILPENKDKEL